MQPQRHFSADPDIRIDIAKAGAVLALVLLGSMVAIIVQAVRLAAS